MNKEERRNKILSLFKEGYTTLEIGQKISLSKAGVNRILRTQIGNRKEFHRMNRQVLDNLLIEAKTIPSYLLAKKYNYSQSGMNDLLKRNGITPLKRQPTTHCECGKEVYIGKYCRECFNYRHNQRYKKHRVSAHRWKFNSYEPACLLPENWSANLHKLRYKIVYN